MFISFVKSLLERSWGRAVGSSVRISDNALTLISRTIKMHPIAHDQHLQIRSFDGEDYNFLAIHR